MLVAALLAAAIAAVAVVLAVIRGGGHGPLVPLIDGNTSDRQLVLDRVQGAGPQNGGPDILGAYVLSSPNAIGRVDGYRVPANGRAPRGAIVAPHAQVELVFGVKAKPDRRSFTALEHRLPRQRRQLPEPGGPRRVYLPTDHGHELPRPARPDTVGRPALSSRSSGGRAGRRAG